MPNKINISSSKQKIIVYIVLTVVIFAVYWQVHQYNFVNFDDNFVVYENHHIQSSINWDALRWAFTTNQADLWSPVLWISLLIDYQFYGLNAGGYHVTNLILHILSALMLFWLFNRMTKALWPSAFVAAVFALHPLHVESVAWVTERKDVLSAFFWMLTLCLYAWYTEKPVIKRYLPVLFCFFCGLMSKPMIVTLPVIMILLDYWPLNRFDSEKEGLLKNAHLPCCAANRTAQRISIYASRFGFLRALHLSIFEQPLKNGFFNNHIGGTIMWQLKEKAPFFILSAVFSVITFYVQYYIPSTHVIKSEHYPLDYRLVNAAVSFAAYLEKTFWPRDMAVFYPFPARFSASQVLVSVILIIIVSVAAMMKAKKSPYYIVGWLWYAITILPVIKIVQIGNDAMADRYHYLPSIGICVMAAWGISSLIKNEFLRRNILFPSAMAVVAFLAVITWQQCGYWRNSSALFSRALQVTKENPVAHGQLGLAMFAEGKIKEAVDHYNEALRLSPGYVEMYNQRGDAFIVLGQYQRAIDNYNENIRLIPKDPNPYNNRGYVYIKLGRYDLAFEDFTKAINLNPEDADAHDNRAFLYLKKGNTVLGCRDAQKACELGNCKTLQQAWSEGYCR